MTSPFAALDVAVGKVIGKRFRRCRSEEFRKFLDYTFPPISTSTTTRPARRKPLVRQASALARPLHVHYTPTPWPDRTLLRLVDGKAIEARCPLFDDNVYQRGEAPVLKPALSGAVFEADRGACGALKCRCPAAAFGCAGRKECCRAAPGRRAVRVDKHDRRLFTPPLGAAPRGDRRSTLERKPGRQRLRRSTAGGACGPAS